MEKKELIEFFMQKIQELNINLDTYEIVDKENENIKEKEDNNYKGFNLHQFLSGAFIDILVFIRMEVEENKNNHKNPNNNLSINSQNNNINSSIQKKNLEDELTIDDIYYYL